MNYYKQILEHRSFRKNFFSIAKNAFVLLFFLIFKRKIIFNVSTKFVSFKLNFEPLKKKMGGRGIFVYREKIEPLMEYGLKFISKNDTCIDAGANQGIYAIPFAKIIGSRGRVIAIEPMKYAQKIIKKNARLNNLKNISIFNGVVSSTSGKEILDYSDGVGSASIVRNFGKKNIIIVHAITIDSLVKKYGIKKVNFIIFRDSFT